MNPLNLCLQRVEEGQFQKGKKGGYCRIISAQDGKAQVGFFQEDKPMGKFCEVSVEELAWLLLQEVGVRLSSFNLAVRFFTPEKLPVSYGVVTMIAQILDLLPEMPQPEEDPAVLPDLTQLTRKDLCDILELVGVKKPQGRKDVYVKTVAELFVQSQQHLQQRQRQRQRLWSCC